MTEIVRKESFHSKGWHDPGIAAQADVVYKMQDGRLAVEC